MARIIWYEAGPGQELSGQFPYRLYFMLLDVIYRMYTVLHIMEGKFCILKCIWNSILFSDRQGISLVLNVLDKPSHECPELLHGFKFLPFLEDTINYKLKIWD